MRVISLLVATLVVACSGGATDLTDDVGTETNDAGGGDAPTDDAGGDDGDAGSNNDDGPPDPWLVHDFGEITVDGGGEMEPCVQWTLRNERPLYVNTVTLGNDGAFHHSNWLVVPDSAAPGPDGYFTCQDRGFDEVSLAVQGTALFAQSTQAREEVQDFPDGVVIKIPPNSKIVAGLHLLNVSTQEVTTGMRMRLDLVHPRDVETVAMPFRLSYYDLHIAPNGQSRFTAECDLADGYEDFTGEPFEWELYYVLPHYHALGNYFRLDVAGGARDGETLFELEGFNAEANGQSFDPAVDLTGATGITFTCGFNNPRDEEVGWGIGDQEMCVMLGYTNANAMFDASVGMGENTVVGEQNGMTMNQGTCDVTWLPRNANQSMPDEDEIERDLYVPPTDEDQDIDAIPECVDTPGDATSTLAPTLDRVHSDVFAVGCTFSSCHDVQNPAYGLDLESRDGLRDRLMNHEVQSDVSVPLVDPGNADGSWLYQLLSQCEPQTDSGPVSAMPRSTQNLLDPELVALVRDWIDDGAPE